MEAPMQRLSQVLWRERELLEGLQYALEVEQLILASGRNRWLMRAATDVESVLQSLRKTEVLRAVAADEVASVLGLAPNPSLKQLAATAGEPWGEILGDHRDAFVAMTQAITELADSNRDLITSGYRSARETLLAMDEAADGYTADGTAVLSPALAAPSRIDRRF
jgi:hypothetical protein